jgi:hypothetical protein
MSKEKKVGFCPERLQPTHELPSLCICVQSYLPITSLSRDQQVSEDVCHPLLELQRIGFSGISGIEGLGKVMFNKVD